MSRSIRRTTRQRTVKNISPLIIVNRMLIRISRPTILRQRTLIISRLRRMKMLTGKAGQTSRSHLNANNIILTGHASRILNRLRGSHQQIAKRLRTGLNTLPRLLHQSIVMIRTSSYFHAAQPPHTSKRSSFYRRATYRNSVTQTVPCRLTA